MKRTCIYCKVIYDDGQPYPRDCQGDFRDPKKNHGICAICQPTAEAEVDRWLLDMKMRKEKKEPTK
jgi:hypothetical protein